MVIITSRLLQIFCPRFFQVVILGVADISGRRYGKRKLPYNQQKSWAGSISMFTFGFLISIGMLNCFTALGYLELDWSSMVGRVALVSLVATIVESFPTTDVLDDNLSAP